ncbi:mitochondrial inner membrane protein OXA1L [Ara ararauna]
MGQGAPEVRLEELGLGAFTPVGLVQNFLQYLHLDLGLPWWGAIAAGTLCVRVALLPLLVRAQREAALLALHSPRLQQLSGALAQARRGSDQTQVARAYTELVGYQQRHNINPLRGFLVPLIQTPVFVSFFLALQKMAAAPVPAMQWGGLAWFPDLTAPDPFYVLPVLVTASMWLVLGGVAGAQRGACPGGRGGVAGAVLGGGGGGVRGRGNSALIPVPLPLPRARSRRSISRSRSAHCDWLRPGAATPPGHAPRGGGHDPGGGGDPPPLRALREQPPVEVELWGERAAEGWDP